MNPQKPQQTPPTNNPSDAETNTQPSIGQQNPGAAQNLADSASLAAPTPQTDQSADSVIVGGVNPTAPHDPPRRRKKGLIFGLILAAVVLLLSGGAAASYYYYANRPENVLKQALANAFSTDKVGTVKFSGTLSMEDKSAETNLEATYKGAADNKTGVFDISGSADAVLTKISFDLRSPDAKTYYVRVGGLNGLAGLLGSSGADLYSPIIEKLDNQWIEINESFLKQLDKSWESGPTSEVDSNKIAQAYTKHSFLVIKEVLKDEVIKGQNSYHYKIVIDPAVLKSFVAALKEAKLDGYDLNQESVDRVNKMIDQAKLEKYPFEVWISKSGKLITQIVFQVSEDEATLKLTHTIESYNSTVDVKKPEGAKSILEIMGEFSKSFNLQSGMPLSSFKSNSSGGISL